MGKKSRRRPNKAKPAKGKDVAEVRSRSDGGRHVGAIGDGGGGRQLAQRAGDRIQLTAEGASAVCEALRDQQESIFNERARQKVHHDAVRWAVDYAKQNRSDDGEPHVVAIGAKTSDHITGSETSIPDNEIPVPFSTVIPVYMHDEFWRTGKKPLARIMTPLQLLESYGEDAMNAMCDAFRNFTDPGACFPDMPPDEVFRHGLGMYLMRHVGAEPPHSQLSYLLGQINNLDPSHDNKLLAQLVDPSRLEEKRPELRVAVAIREGASKKLETRDNPEGIVLTIAIVLVLTGTCDVWHPKNTISPGHRQLLRALKSKFGRSHDSCNENIAERTLKLPPKPGEPEAEERLKQKALDEEFASLSFEEVLAQEQEAARRSQEQEAARRKDKKSKGGE